MRLLKATEVGPLFPVNNWKMKMASKLRKKQNKTKKQEKNKSVELCFLKKLVSYGQMVIGLFKRHHKTHLFFQFTLRHLPVEILILIKYFLYNPVLFFSAQ